MTEEVASERLQNDEFRELIPYLQLEDLFLIQIKNEEWQQLFEGVIENERQQIRCNMCADKPKLQLKEFDAHIKRQEHKNALKGVGQFYHPVYTHEKDSDSGENRNAATQTEEAKLLAMLVQNSKQRTVRLPMDDIMSIICFQNVKKFPLIVNDRFSLIRCVLCNTLIKDINSHFQIEDHIHKMRSLTGINVENHPDVNKNSIIQCDMESKDIIEYEKILRKIVQKQLPKAPHMMHLIYEMPIEELLKVQWIKGSVQWNPLLLKVGEKPDVYKCVLCSLNVQLGSLQFHLNGKQHKTRQLEIGKMRHYKYNKLSKSCILSPGPALKIQISLKARKMYRNDVLRELKNRKIERTNNMSVAETSGDLKNNSSLSKQNQSEDTVEIMEIDDVEKKNNYEEIHQPQLSAQLTEKLDNIKKKSVAKIKSDSSADQSKTISKKSKLDIEPEEALIGVEYVVKIINQKTPLYECCLCEVVMNEYRMQNHLTGYNHRYKYCELHYSSALKKYQSYFTNIKYYDMFLVMGPILAKIAYGIEEYHGRSTPTVVLADVFKSKRPDIIAKLYCSKHADQLYGPSYTNLFSEEDIKNLLANKSSLEGKPKQINKTHTIQNRFAVLQTGQMYCSLKVRASKVEQPVVREGALRDKVVDIRRRSRSKSPKNHSRRDEHFSQMPRERSQSGNNDHRQSIWQKYRQQILISASEVERAYIDYRNNPESHPLYDQEWNRFWKQRKDELASQGIDHRSYNFQPDWVPFFRNRLEQLFGEALQHAKQSVRVRLNIPMDMEEDTDPDAQFRGRQLAHFRPEPPAPKKQRVDTESLVSQWHSQTNNRAFREKRNEGSKTEGNQRSNSLQDMSDVKPDVIHVLRLMAAFEDYLGSLGPKVTDLLFMTLSMDKSAPKGSLLLEKKVLTHNNCSLLETAMEKLRGTLYAGLLDPSKQNGFQQVIKFTENLLNYAESMGYRQQFSPSQDKLDIPKTMYPQSTSLTNESNLQQLMNLMTNEKVVQRNSNENKGGFSYGIRDIRFPSNIGENFNKGNTCFSSKQHNIANSNNTFNQDGNNYNESQFQNNANFNKKFLGYNAVSKSSFTQNDDNFNKRNSSLAGNSTNSQMAGINNSLQGFNQSNAITKIAGVVGRNNYNNPNLNNRNNAKTNYPNPGNSGSRGSGGFSGNWKMNSNVQQSNVQHPNFSNSERKQMNMNNIGQMSALQLQNLKQLQFLRQQQQQRKQQQIEFKKL